MKPLILSGEPQIKVYLPYLRNPATAWRLEAANTVQPKLPLAKKQRIREPRRAFSFVTMLYARSFKYEHSLLSPRVGYLSVPLCDFLTRQVVS